MAPLKYFAELKDPRVERNRDHVLEEILLIAIAAVLSGAESWNGHGGIWKGQDGLAENISPAPFQHSLVRYLQPRLCGARPHELEKGFLNWVSAITQADFGGRGGH